MVDLYKPANEFRARFQTKAILCELEYAVHVKDGDADLI